jgi:hypothetical protein
MTAEDTAGLLASRAPDWLLGFRHDVFSQAGEDGVIAKILDLLPARDRWCVEFGAWDGILYSNTRHLIESDGYSAVLIEGDAARAVDLRRNYATNPRVTPLNQLVGFSAHDNLDHVLSATAIPLDFDFLSIDVDGTDFYIWQAITKYSPKVVCVEFNPTIPTEASFVQPPDPSVRQGTGLLPLVALGKTKGYELVCVLHCNAVFVMKQYFPLFGIADNRPGNLRQDVSGVTYLFSGYDGEILLSGSRRMPWHGVPITEPRVQQLPGFLRKFPDRYTRLERLAFDWLFFRKQLLQRVARLFGKRTTG